MFPSFCVGCKKEGSFLCDECKEKIEILKTPSHFPEKSKVEKFYCATEYRQETIEKLISSFKYKFIKDIKNELGDLVISHLELTGFVKNENQVLLPVPLHKKRLHWRGFNQSEALAENIGNYFNIPVVTNVLLRTKYTEHQTLRQNRKERVRNIRGAFSCKNSKVIENKEVILIDDVVTSGTTLKECAKELSKYDIKKIFAIVVAK